MVPTQHFEAGVMFGRKSLVFRFGKPPVSSLLTYGLAIAPSYGHKNHEQILKELTAELVKWEGTQLCEATTARLEAIKTEMNVQKEKQQNSKVLLTL